MDLDEGDRYRDMYQDLESLLAALDKAFDVYDEVRSSPSSQGIAIINTRASPFYTSTSIAFY
jgi:hypothetical protein